MPRTSCGGRRERKFLPKRIRLPRSRNAEDQPANTPGEQPGCLERPLASTTGLATGGPFLKKVTRGCELNGGDMATRYSHTPKCWKWQPICHMRDEALHICYVRVTQSVAGQEHQKSPPDGVAPLGHLCPIRTLVPGKTGRLLPSSLGVASLLLREVQNARNASEGARECCSCSPHLGHPRAARPGRNRANANAAGTTEYIQATTHAFCLPWP